MLGGIYSGIVTVTEAAGLAAGSAMVVALFVYREVKPWEVLRISTDAMKSAGMIMIIIATATVFGHWITHAGIPARLVELVREMGLPNWVFLLFCNLLFLFLGMFLEVISIMLITLPILFSAVIELGISPIHFGVMMVVNMEVALITPPVGLNLFIASYRFRKPVAQLYVSTLPFLAILLIALIATNWARYAKMARARALTLRETEFVQATEVLGYSRPRILLRHLLPNVYSEALAYGLSAFIGVIGAVATLSYLGMGVRPPTPEWGAMIADGRLFLRRQSWITLCPGLVLTLTSIGVALLARGVVARARGEEE